jgi:predicted peptidase
MILRRSRLQYGLTLDHILIVIIFLLSGILCLGLLWDYLPLRAGVQHEMFFNGESKGKMSMDYLLFLPVNYYKDKRLWPLMIFLHGAGDRGNDLKRLKKYGPPMLVETEKEFPFIVISPQCPADSNWELNTLNALLDEVVANYRVDKDRIYITGLSMGGFGAWALAAAYPERFAAVVPICGGGNPDTVDRLKNMAIWVFHGAKDDRVPLEQSEKMVEALKTVGANVKFTVYPEGKHDCWTETYAKGELYQWLLEQKRANKGSEKVL